MASPFRPFRAPLAAILVAAGACAATPTVNAQSDAAKASFWSTPPPKASGGWGTATASTARPTTEPARVEKAAAAAKAVAPPTAVTAAHRTPAPRRTARPRPTRRAITLAWTEPGLASPSHVPSAAASAGPARAEPSPAAPRADTPSSAPQPARVGAAADGTTTTPVATPAPEPQQVVAPKDPVRPSAPAAKPTLEAFPTWMTLNVFYRGRVEATRAIATRGSENDPYYLNRLRVRALFAPTPYLELLGEGQDSRVAGFDGVGVPRTMRNVFDLRQAYIDLHAKGGKAWRVRVGRQELGFGDSRLIASPDWGNTNRTFDLVRASAARGRARVDVFGGYVVQLEPSEFDRRKKGEYLYGAWGVIDKVAPSTAVEPFVIVKHNDDVVGEDAVRGDAELVTVGVRATSKLLNRVDAATDVVVQQGSFANDDIRGWAFHQMLAIPFARQPWKPRVVIDYATASGDDDPTDGRRQTFDQLYSSNHARYGLADQIGWRNMHDLGVIFEASPHKALKVSVGAHQFLLRTVNDGFYASNGTRAILNRKATSRNVGVEVDGWFQWTVSKDLSLSGGLGSLLASDYLRESTDGRTLLSPYLLWNVKF